MKNADTVHNTSVALRWMEQNKTPWRDAALRDGLTLAEFEDVWPSLSSEIFACMTRVTHQNVQSDLRAMGVPAFAIILN